MTTAEPTTALATRQISEAIEIALIEGDLSGLSPEQRASHYFRVCESLKLNPYTKPFAYLELDVPGGEGEKKLELYARKDCTDQLRSVQGVSITKLEHRQTEALYIVTAYAQDRHGRQDSAVGAVPIAKEGGTWKTSANNKRYLEKDGTMVPLTGEALANAIMKAETKAKRRVTLSLCGLGLTDESEVDSIPNARVIEVDLPQRTEVVREQASPVEDTQERERAMRAWLDASAAAKQLGVEHRQLNPDETSTAKVWRWADALQAKVDEERAKAPVQPPTEAEVTAPRDEATGEVLDDTPFEVAAPSPPDRSALWAENRQLVARAQELHLTGVPTLNQRIGSDALVAANDELRQRIENVELDQRLASEQA